MPRGFRRAAAEVHAAATLSKPPWTKAPYSEALDSYNACNNTSAYAPQCAHLCGALSLVWELDTPSFIGWAKNHFNNLPFKTSLETKNST